jgi:hypothetical protein
MFHTTAAAGAIADGGGVRTANGPSSDAIVARRESALVQTHKRASLRSGAERAWCIGHVWPTACGHLQATVAEDAPCSVAQRVVGTDTSRQM